jgi:hypothetical protein
MTIKMTPPEQLPNFNFMESATWRGQSDCSASLQIHQDTTKPEPGPRAACDRFSIYKAVDIC